MLFAKRQRVFVRHHVERLAGILKCEAMSHCGYVKQAGVEAVHVLQRREKKVHSLWRLRQGLAGLAKVQRLQRVWERAVHQLRRRRRQMGSRLERGMTELNNSYVTI
jgi:hypothetical protein